MTATGTWHFAHIFSKVKPDAGQEPTLTIEGLGEAPRDELCSLNRTVREYGRTQDLIDAVARNMGEFVRSFVEGAALFMRQRTFARGELSDLTSDYSRLLVNLLSMFRIFLEHSETVLVRQFGKDSQELDEWRSATAREWDGVFAYRFIYALRNYCLHIGMPPLQVSYSSSANDDSISCELNIQVKVLLEESTCWKAKLLEDLKAQTGDIPVMQTLDDWSRAFWRVARAVMDVQRRTALPAAQKILRYREQLNVPAEDGELCAIWLPDGVENPSVLSMTIMHLEEPLSRKVVAGPSWAEDGGA